MPRIPRPSSDLRRRRVDPRLRRPVGCSRREPREREGDPSQGQLGRARQTTQRRHGCGPDATSSSAITTTGWLSARWRIFTGTRLNGHLHIVVPKSAGVRRRVPHQLFTRTRPQVSSAMAPPMDSLTPQQAVPPSIPGGAPDFVSGGQAKARRSPLRGQRLSPAAHRQRRSRPDAPLPPRAPRRWQQQYGGGLMEEYFRSRRSRRGCTAPYRPGPVPVQVAATLAADAAMRGGSRVGDTWTGAPRTSASSSSTRTRSLATISVQA